MPDALPYAARPPPARRIVWDCGPAGMTVILPPPPLWQSLTVLGLGAAGIVSLAVFGVVQYRRLVQVTRPDLCSILPLAVTLLAFAAAVLHIVQLLRRAPRAAGEPTVISASGSGLLITTAGSVGTQRFGFPAEEIVDVAVLRGPRTVTLRHTVRLAVRHREAGRISQAVFEFTTREPRAGNQLATELGAALGRPVAAEAPWVDSWGNPTPI